MTTSELGEGKAMTVLVMCGIVKSQDEQEIHERRIKGTGHRALNVCATEALTAEKSWVTVSKEVKV